MDRDFCFMISGGLLFGLVFGIGGIFILGQIGIIGDDTAPYMGVLWGGSLGIVSTCIGLIVGAKLSK